jgi:mxaJ protein
MSFHCKMGCWLLLLATLTANAAETPRVLRIAADPNNLPFSNDKLEGFENKIAEIIARDLGAKIQYSWRAQRRGFFRETLKENTADLVLGVPSQFERALTTRPYYRSCYAFVSRKERHLNIRSFDEPALRSLKIGVQLVGDDGANTPPAHALAMRGIITNVVGFSLYGDYSQPNPPARIVDAVARGDIDIAVVWGPLAGYFAKRQSVPLDLQVVENQLDHPALPLAFDISLGVGRKNKELRDELDRILEQHRPEIAKLLDDYGVPRVPVSPKKSNSEERR